MKFNAEKMRSIARKSTDEEKAKRTFRSENAEWLNTSAKIALSIRTLLRTLGISQAELAKRMDVTPAQVTKILSGKENLGLKTICKVEAALNAEIVCVPVPEMA